tara:strand:- start:58717 stop:59298 length:582 start_codon:yes stop_codon:yes gene_type:complete
MKKESALTDKAISNAVKLLRKSKKVEQVSLTNISNQLSVPLEELHAYFSNVEDIFLKAQKKDWEKTHRILDKKIRQSKTPGDFMGILDSFFEQMVTDLSQDADLRYEMSMYLPACHKYREKNKKRLEKKLKKVIQKGWPGKSTKVLERQSALIILIFYGFLDHIVHIDKPDRKKILRDFSNMVSLHLQDRKFF